MKKNYQAWLKTLIDLMKRSRKSDFTGTIHVEMNEGGISSIRKEEKVKKTKEFREG